MTTRFPTGLWAIVLIVSVLANGLILGMVVAGAAMDVRVGRAPPQIAGGPPLRGFESSLPDELRQDFGASLRARALEARPLVEEMREANEAAMQALAAEPFDEAAARAAFERTRVAREALEAQAHDITITLFENLPQDARANLVRRAGSRIVLRGFDGDRDGPGRDWRREWRGRPDGDGPPRDGPPASESRE